VSGFTEGVTKSRRFSRLLRRLLARGRGGGGRMICTRTYETGRPVRVGAGVGAGAGAGGQSAASLEVKLAAIEGWLETLSQQVESLPAGSLTGVEQQASAAGQALTALEKQINRAGRELFKANALSEAQGRQLADAIELLQAREARREAEVASLRGEKVATQTAARLEVVQALLPTLDGLDEALRSGRQLLARLAQVDSALTTGTSTPARTFLGRLFAASPSSPGMLSPEQRAEVALREGVGAWLEGLGFVRGRLLDVLMAEGVMPIETEGQPFDPQRHVALEAVPAGEGVPPGTVAVELRRGYLAGDRVLRYAEVAVAK
jgi:molecular chaperone GrpE (heat shock protein)